MILGTHKYITEKSSHDPASLILNRLNEKSESQLQLQSAVSFCLTLMFLHFSSLNPQTEKISQSSAREWPVTVCLSVCLSVSLAAIIILPTCNKKITCGGGYF